MVKAIEKRIQNSGEVEFDLPLFGSRLKSAELSQRDSGVLRNSLKNVMQRKTVRISTKSF